MLYKICSVKNILNLYLFSNYPEVAGRFISSGCEMMRYEKRPFNWSQTVRRVNWYRTELATTVIASPFFARQFFLPETNIRLFLSFDWPKLISSVNYLSKFFGTKIKSHFQFEIKKRGKRKILIFNKLLKLFKKTNSQ